MCNRQGKVYLLDLFDTFYLRQAYKPKQIKAKRLTVNVLNIINDYSS